MGIAIIKNKLFANIPEVNNDMDVLFYIKKQDINSLYLNYLKEITTFKDDVISEWLNISVKTLRTYRKPETSFKENIKEHIVMILSLYDHGIEVFGNAINFDKWLDSNNFYFDNKSPKDFLSTISGIRFIDDRLTAIEYGDNV